MRGQRRSSGALPLIRVLGAKPLNNLFLRQRKQRYRHRHNGQEVAEIIVDGGEEAGEEGQERGEEGGEIAGAYLADKGDRGDREQPGIGGAEEKEFEPGHQRRQPRA